MTFKNLRILFIGLTFLSLSSCGFYSLSGVTLPANVKTFQVDYFGYQAVLVEPGIERDFKIKLEDLIQDQSRLSLTPKKRRLYLSRRNYPILHCSYDSNSK